MILGIGSLPEVILGKMQHYQVLSQRQEGTEVRVRFISDRRAGEDWQACRPGLEDVFLHTYQL